MSLSIPSPVGGITAQLGAKSFPLLLRNGEIERFEEQYSLGIFAALQDIVSGQPQARHVRDLVALGLVGAGMSDRDADRLVSDLPPHHNMALREVARELLLCAFVDPELQKKSAQDDGSASDSDQPSPSTQNPASETQ